MGTVEEEGEDAAVESFECESGAACGTLSLGVANGVGRQSRDYWLVHERPGL